LSARQDRTATALLTVLGRADARQRPDRRVSGAAAVDASGARWTTTIHSPVRNLIPPAIAPRSPVPAPGLCANWAQRLPGSAWPARYQRVQHGAANSACARDMCASPRVAVSRCSPWTRVRERCSLRTPAGHRSPTQRRQQPVRTQAVLKEQISGRSALISADSGLMRPRPMPALSTALGSRVWRVLTDEVTVLAVGDVVVPDVDGSTQPPPPDSQPDQDAHKESEHAAHNAQYYQHGVVHPIPQYAYMSNSLVPAGGMPPMPAGGMPPPQFAVPLGMAQTPGPLPPLSPNSLAKVQGANPWPSVAFSRGPDKKKRQREDFNTSQLKRLVEVYDMEESQRPDREQLAKELDQLDGGRNVDSAAIKAWMKNRFHSLKRTAGARSLV
ncbi:MAG: hypothetical protein ACPIOQ_67800, partial [Promethearchaeia archaeon]